MLAKGTSQQQVWAADPDLSIWTTCSPGTSHRLSKGTYRTQHGMAGLRRCSALNAGMHEKERRYHSTHGCMFLSKGLVPWPCFARSHSSHGIPFPFHLKDLRVLASAVRGAGIIGCWGRNDDMWISVCSLWLPLRGWCLGNTAFKNQPHTLLLRAGVGHAGSHGNTGHMHVAHACGRSHGTLHQC